MKVSYNKSLLVNCAFLGSIACGSSGLAMQARAQNVYTPASSQPVSVTAPPTQSADSFADAKLAKRVKNALHSDPYFDDEHVTVSVERAQPADGSGDLIGERTARSRQQFG